jgi:TRAP-type C4-dicarboxylate transport system permease small subunit
MQGLRKVVSGAAGFMNNLGGLVLTAMMLITVVDVILRFLAKPITGTYELVFLGGAVVIACAIPRTSEEGGHVNVDLISDRLSPVARRVMTVFNKLCGIGFFFLLGWNLFALGTTLFTKEEVSLTLHVPYYPVAYVLGISAFVECFVLLVDLLSAALGVRHE